MDNKNLYFRLFDFTLKSNIPLPELPTSPPSALPFLTFHLTTTSPSDLQEDNWLHHWLLPDGSASISFTRKDDDYILRFPQLADFLFSQEKSYLECHPEAGIPVETIRHLLLDQVVPRIVSYLGRPVIHASCTQIDNDAILFLGNTGWGKSTLVAAFEQNGFPLLCDDCLLLEGSDKGITGIPNYGGVRLLDDSYGALFNTSDAVSPAQRVSHYSTKKRILNPDIKTLPNGWAKIKVLFILTSPEDQPITETLSLSPVKGAAAAIELVKHCFHLDLTDKVTMGKQMQLLTQVCGNPTITIYRMKFQRQHNLLPDICKELAKLVRSLPEDV